MATANTALNRPRGPALIPPQAPPPQAPLSNHACHILRAPVYSMNTLYLLYGWVQILSTIEFFSGS